MEETISIQEIFQVMKKRAGMIVTIICITTLLTWVVCNYFITPIYQASTQLLVNQSKNEEMYYNSMSLSVDLQLVNTYNVIIKSPTIMETVIKDLNLDLTVEELKEKITVSNEEESQVINIEVEDESYVMAANIANKTAQVFKKEIFDIMNVNNVTILAEAKVTGDETPIFPNNLVLLAIAIIGGAFAGIGLAFLQEYLDNTLKTEKDIKKYLEFPVLGVVYTFDGNE